jgi:membrane-associated phospholipid phosphatase
LAGEDARERVVRWRGARGLALLTLEIYLAWSGVLLAVGGHTAYATGHAVVMGVVFGAAVSRGRAARVIADLAPLVLMPLLYSELPLLMAALGSTYHDVVVQQLEQRMFGEQVSRTFAGAHPNVLLSELLHAGYLAYYPAVFAPALLLYARGERRGFAQTVLTLSVTYAICWVIFALFPVEGPRYEWGAPLGVPNGPVRRFALAILASGSSRGAAFPSSHMAISVAQAVIAWRWHPKAGAVLSVVALLVGLGAVYGGFHYGADIVAGATLGLVTAVAILTRTPGRDSIKA